MNILVTGATGLLGGALVAALIKAGHRVTALVHRTSEIVGNDGSLMQATPFDGATVDDRKIITVMRADIREPGLGLNTASRCWLDGHIDVVIHCAALVQFDYLSEFSRYFGGFAGYDAIGLRCVKRTV